MLVQKRIGRLLATTIIASVTGLTASALECSLSDGTKELKPAHWVTVKGAPFEASDTDTHLYAYIQIGEEERVVPAWADGTDGFYFRVPASLVSPWSNVGVDEFWLSDGETGCQITGLTRTGLRRKSGVLESLLLGSAYHTTELVRGLGIDTETRTYLESGEAAERDLVRPMIMARRDFESFADVKSLAARDAEFGEILAVIDSYLAESGTVERLLDSTTREQDVSDAFEDGDLKESHWYGAEKFEARIPQAPAKPASGGGFRQSGKALMSNKAPKSPSELAAMLNAHLDSAAMSAPWTSLYRDYAGTLFGVSGAMFEAGQFPPGKYLTGGAANALFLQGMFHKVRDGLYPETLVKLDIRGGPYALRPGSVPTEGKITAIYVTPSAKGVNLAGLVADAVLNFVPFGGASKAVRGRLAKKAVKDAAEDVLESTVRQRIKKRVATEVAQTKAWRQSKTLKDVDYKEFFETYFDGLLKQSLALISGNSKWGNVAVVPPFWYEPVNIMEPGWYMANLDTQAFLNWDNQGDLVVYSAKAEGQSIAIIGTQPGRYGNAHLTENISITVGDPALLVSPDRKVIMPGATVSYDVTVLGADPMQISERKVDAEVKQPFAVTYTGETANGALAPMQSFSVKTSKSTGDYPAEVTFKSRHFYNVTSERLIELPRIAPNLACVPEGETVKFFAPDEAGEPLANTVWELDGPGRLDSSGSYTAPQRSGSSATIRLVSLSGDTIDEQDIAIGCSCQWSMAVDAKPVVKGTMVSVSTYGSGDSAGYTLMSMDGEDGVMTIAGEGSAVQPATTGVNLSHGDNHYVSGIQLYTPPDSQCRLPSSEMLSWQTLGDDWLTGQVIGDAVKIDTIGSTCPTLVPFEVSFITRLDGQRLTNLDNVLGGMAQGQVPGMSADTAALMESLAGAGLNISACFDEGSQR